MPIDLDPIRPRLFGAIPEPMIAAVSFRRLPASALAVLRQTPDATCLVADVLDARGIGDFVPAAEVAPLTAGQHVCGQVVTLRCEPYGGAPQEHRRRDHPLLAGDRDVYALALPGDVAVITAGGDTTSAVLGDISQAFARHAGLAGLIVDGAVRDVATLRTGGVPVWSRGASPLAARYRWAAAELNGTVSFAGARIEPGDVVVADDNGLCVVPLAHAETVIAECGQLLLRETDMLDAISAATSFEDLIRRVRGNTVT